MKLTNVLLKKAKSKIVMVLLESTGSTHKHVSFRERTEDKKEMIHFDPYINRTCVYKEVKKIRGMKYSLNIKPDFYKDTYGVITKELIEEIAQDYGGKVPYRLIQGIPEVALSDIPKNLLEAPVKKSKQ